MNRTTTIASVLAGVLLLGAIVVFSLSGISSAASGPQALADQTACRSFDLDRAYSDAESTGDRIRSKIDDADASRFPFDHYVRHLN